MERLVQVHMFCLFKHVEMYMLGFKYEKHTRLGLNIIYIEVYLLMRTQKVFLVILEFLEYYSFLWVT